MANGTCFSSESTVGRLGFSDNCWQLMCEIFVVVVEMSELVDCAIIKASAA
jgi:hypothetical protein